MTDDARHLKIYVGKIDGEVRRHLDKRWAGRADSHSDASDEAAHVRHHLVAVLGHRAWRFQRSLIWSVTLRASPKARGRSRWFTTFSRSLGASARARRLLTVITRETKAKLERGEASREAAIS
ncbi:hypothetical protein PR202_gb20994 [Eleusine coracana subsp. coracana]|uniref:Uncharacterized protein n=1 Tax=Eleusine coracana subsp. coracana TaxID=191504 RepID=A0AAV5FC41_ELECO|nr:hypothetical protein PR202_gb20994 [Eleusine coracana subsp. coracana]